MREWSQGVTWHSPQANYTTKRHADSYVDDTTMWINGISDVNKLKQRMQTDLTSYEEMLVWTGGALTLSKCFFSLIDWEFKPDGLPQQTEHIHALYIPHPVHEQREIRSLTNTI